MVSSIRKASLQKVNRLYHQISDILLVNLVPMEIDWTWKLEGELIHVPKDK